MHNISHNISNGTTVVHVVRRWPKRRYAAHTCIKIRSEFYVLMAQIISSSLKLWHIAPFCAQVTLSVMKRASPLCEDDIATSFVSLCRTVIRNRVWSIQVPSSVLFITLAHTATPWRGQAIVKKSQTSLQQRETKLLHCRS